MAKKTAVGGMDFGGDWEDWVKVLLFLSALGLPVPAKWKVPLAVLLFWWRFLR